MRILITGASGFIGSTVARHLTSMGHQTVALVHRSAAPACVAQVILSDLGADNTADALLRACEPVDAIVHAAACINYQHLAQEVIRVNCLGLQQLLAIAQTWRVQTFVNFSSIGVVGVPLQHPVTEQHPTSPRTTYHATKLFGEQLISLSGSTQMSAVSLRITAPVGVGMPNDRILSVFVRQALQNAPLKLSGGGMRTQNYVDVRDIIQAVTLCLEHRPVGIFNVAGPRAISNLELAQLCVRLLNSTSTIEFAGNVDAAESETWDVSSEAAKQAFNYTPTYDIESSIEKISSTLQFCEK